MSTFPERIRWAIELLELLPSSSVLEIGGGNGLAASLVLQHLEPGGRLIFVERSPVAIGRAVARNADSLRIGRFVPLQAEIVDLDIGSAEFDRVFAVNVNVFWTGDAAPELRVIRRALRPEGFLLLIYGAPSPERLGEIAESVGENLSAAGFTTAMESNGSLLGIRAG